MPTIETFEFWCAFHNAYDPDTFHIMLSAWWKTYHEFTL